MVEEYSVAVARGRVSAFLHRKPTRDSRHCDNDEIPVITSFRADSRKHKTHAVQLAMRSGSLRSRTLFRHGFPPKRKKLAAAPRGKFALARLHFPLRLLGSRRYERMKERMSVRKRERERDKEGDSASRRFTHESLKMLRTFGTNIRELRQANEWVNCANDIVSAETEKQRERDRENGCLIMRPWYFHASRT